MARENQGLQVALIVFVMLWIISTVLAFVCYRSYTDQVVKADEATKQSSDANGKLRTAQDEIGKLNAIIGAGPNDPTDTVLDQGRKELSELLLKSFPAAQHNYKMAVKHLGDELAAKSISLDKDMTARMDLDTRFKEREAASQKQMDVAKGERDKAKNDLKAETDKYVQDRGAMTAQRGDLLKQVDAAKTAVEKAMTDAAAQVALIQKQMKEVVAQLQQRNDQLIKMTRPTFEVASGRIEWVDNRNRTVWINLGNADHLPKLISLSVYDAKTSDVARAERKASIEVTQILGPNLAVARILKDDLKDPILTGDVIHTPLWQPGQQRHFALAGFIDTDKDGKSDQDLLVKLIQMNHGVIDSMPVRDADGKIRRLNDRGEPGRITGETDYIIRGEEPTVEAADKGYVKDLKAEVADFNSVSTDSERLGIRKVTVDQFLGQVGYRSDNRLLDTRHPSPEQLKAQPPEGGQKKSSGPVSPLFQPRNPPRPGPIGAY